MCDDDDPIADDNWRLESLRLIKPLWLNSTDKVVASFLPSPADVTSISTKVLVPK